jgi:hypothetical protein
MRASRDVQDVMRLGDVAGKVRVPTLLLEGIGGRATLGDQMRRVADSLTNAQLEVVLELDGDHCRHNMSQLVRPRMADWLADKLRAA